MTDNRLQVRLIDDKVATWLTDRNKRMHTGSIHVQARVELSLWHTALQAELRRMRFTVAELNCIAYAMNNALIQPGIAITVPAAFAELSDAFTIARENDPAGISSYGAKWGIDEEMLLAKVRALGPTADHALHDAVSRWWESQPDDGTGTDEPEEGWPAVGLTPIRERQAR
jgi:hypothetical protein